MEEAGELATAFVFAAMTVDGIEVCLIVAIVMLVCVVTYEFLAGRE